MHRAWLAHRPEPRDRVERPRPGIGSTICRGALLGRSAGLLRGLITLALLLAALPASAETGVVHLTFYAGSYFEPAELTSGGVSLHTRWERYDPIEIEIEDGSFKVEYGIYLLRVGLGGFEQYEREIFVRPPRTDVLVDLRLGEIADFVGLPPPTRFEGFVKTDLAPDKLWVRAIPMPGTGTKAFDARPEADGRFQVTVDSGGDFLVLVLHETPSGKTDFIDLPIVATKRTSVGSYQTETLEINIP